jgi:thiamine-phosphate pyrophosphorylase
MKRSLQQLPRICVISSGKESLCCGSLALRLASSLSGLPPVIFQLREKHLETKTLSALALRLKPLLSSSSSLFMVNERTDVALAAGAAGVHLPESSCPADSIRRIFPEMLVGKSVHSLESAIEAEKTGVDYLLYGPVYATPSKERFGPAQGLDALERICRSVSMPVFAVGGITPQRAYACIENGAYGIAAITAFLDSGSMPEIMEHFQSILLQ